MSELESQQTPMVTIVSALNCEAKPWVDHFKLKKQTDKPFWHYASDSSNVEVLISGVGGLSMATAVGWVSGYHGARVCRPRAWLNLGIAGDEKLPVGSIRRVHAVINSDDLRKLHPPLTAKWRGQSSAIASVNAPTNSYVEGAMVDMESYAFFKAATQFSTAELVQSIKVISDNQEKSFEHLDASKITALMSPHVDAVNQFIAELEALSPAQAPRHPWAHLLQAPGSHSQRQQLNAALNKAFVLDLHAHVDALGFDLKTPIKLMLSKLQQILDSSAPSLEARS